MERRAPEEQDAEAAIDAELDFHFAEVVAGLMERGWSEADARKEAQRRFGDRVWYRADLVRIERQSVQWRWLMNDVARSTGNLLRLDSLLRDVRYAFRTLTRSPVFTAVALLALALGIGANTAVFSVVNAVLLRPLPFADPDRLVMVFNYAPRGAASMADFLDWRARSQSFESIGVFEVNPFTNSRFTWIGDGEPEQVFGYRVTASFFDILGVRPILGRTFTVGEDEPGRPRAVVLSERLWRRRYGANPDVLGNTAVLNGRNHTIIGVMPAVFELWNRDADAWATLPLDRPPRRGPFFVRGVARLKAGVSLEQASAEMRMIASDIERTHPQSYNQLRIPVVPVRDVVVGNIRPLLWVLSGAVAIVLLIAVSNVANLTLGRASSRSQEIAIRLSIGASRGQLIRQLLIESVVLALIGAVLGTALAGWGVTALRSVGPADFPRLGEISVDRRVLGFTLLVSALSAVLFGLLPALTASGMALGPFLKDGNRGGESHRQGQARAAIVAAQVTLSVVLLIGAGLLIRSFSLLGRVDPGFSAPPERVLLLFVSPPSQRFNTPDALATYWNQLLGRVRAVPGVEEASLSNVAPPDRSMYGDSYEIEGHAPRSDSVRYSVPVVPYVSHDYFKTLGIPLLRGRWFDPQDTPSSSRATVISDAMARRHFVGEDPIGQRIRFGGQSLEIVGVVGDVKYRGLHRDNEPTFYQLESQAQRGEDMWLLMRTSRNADSLTATVRQEIRSLDPGVPVDRIGTMAGALSQSVALSRFRSFLMTVFATTALLLAAIGIYGVVAYSVVRRTREIGVRMALGATPSGVLVLVVRQGSQPVVVGMALGLAGALALTRVLEGMLFGVTASDPLTFAGGVVALSAVSVLACLVPALRASRIDPLAALRYE
jgi:putative ABC transport system permease protein